MALCAPPLRKALASVEVDELFEGTGKDREQTGYTKKIKTTDKLKALELLGKHLKMFTDVTEVRGLEGLGDRLRAARLRERACRLKQKKG